MKSALKLESFPEESFEEGSLPESGTFSVNDVIDADDLAELLPAGVPSSSKSGAKLQAMLGSLAAAVRGLFGRRPAADEAVDLPAAGDDHLADELAAMHHDLVEAIQSTSAISENGVVAAGAAVGKVVEEAMSQAAIVESHGGREQSTIGEELNGVGGNVRAYVDSLGGLVEAVNAEVMTALEQCQDIVVLTKECSDIVRNGRYLTMMMKVEISRLPNAQNVAFIAEEINAFSDGLQRLLDEVGDITSSLNAELGDLVQSGESLARHGAEDSKRFGQTLSNLDASARAMEAVVYGGREGGADALGSILALSQEALSRFQFHDPMAQDLQTVDVLCAELQTALNAQNGSAEVVEPLVYRKRVGDDAPVDPAQASAGELLMF